MIAQNSHEDTKNNNFNMNNNTNNNINNNNNNSNNYKKIKRNSSLISFISLDMSLKSIYSSLRNKNVDFGSKNGNSSSNGSGFINKKTPYLKVDSVDKDLPSMILTYPQSPGRYRGSIDRTSNNLLNAQIDDDYIRSQTNSPYLSISTQNLRRSSTSDIIGNKTISLQSTSSITTATTTTIIDNRRPSTTDLLRKARERKSSETAIYNRMGMGRSVSHGFIKGNLRGGSNLRGRRTSMAF